MVSRYHLEPHTIDTSMISFFIWTHGENTLHNFHSTIKFTIEYSTTSNPFLDVLVCLNNYISTTLYTKPTNGHCYLNFNSCHSTSLEKKKKKLIIYSQCLCIKCICSENGDYKIHRGQLFNYFLNRNYPLKTIKRSITKVSKQDRNAVLTYETKIKNPEFSQLLILIIIFTNYHRSHQKISST